MGRTHRGRVAALGGSADCTAAKAWHASQEDQGIIITMSTSAPDATLQQRLVYADQVYNKFIVITQRNFFKK
jgi:hypothetical protein